MPKNYLQPHLSIALDNTHPRFLDALKFAYVLTEQTLEQGGSKSTYKTLIVGLDENGDFEVRSKTELELGKPRSLMSWCLWGDNLKK